MILDRKAQKWCNSRGIRVYPRPVANSEGLSIPNINLVIDFKSNYKVGTEVYSQDKDGQKKYVEKIDELYNYLYNRYKDEL